MHTFSSHDLQSELETVRLSLTSQRGADADAELQTRCAVTMRSGGVFRGVLGGRSIGTESSPPRPRRDRRRGEPFLQPDHRASRLGQRYRRALHQQPGTSRRQLHRRSWRGARKPANYLDLFSGTNQELLHGSQIALDQPPILTPGTTALTEDNLGAELRAKGLSFTGYSDGLPSVGYNGTVGTTDPSYQRKHNPWVNWQNDTSLPPGGGNITQITCATRRERAKPRIQASWMRRSSRATRSHFAASL